MNKLKRGLSLLLTLVMVLSMIPATHAHAAEVTSGYCGDPNTNGGKDVSWTFQDGVLTISGTGKTNEYGYMGEMYGVPYGHDHLSTPWTETAVTSLVVEEGVTHILGLLSWGAYNLTDVSLPDSLKVIGHCSFEDCDSLTSITIPKNVTSIWSGAFWACENLTSITFTGDAPSINDYAFNNAVTATCYYPASANWPADKLKSYGGNLTWVPYGECNVHSFGSGDVCTVCGILGGSCGSNLTWTLDDEGNLVITGTGDLQDYNFGSSPFYKYADRITSVSLPDGLTSIGERAFDATFPNLDHIEIPTSVTHIQECAFGATYNKVKLKYPGTMAQWEDLYIAAISSYGKQYGAECSDGTIIYMGPCSGSNGLYDSVKYMLLGDGTLKITGTGDMKFYRYLNYESCFSGDDKITKVVIDEGVTSIAGYAFKNCKNLTEVYIPASVTSISYNVFQGCTALTDVYYGSNEKNWNKMSISSDSNEPLAAATIHYTNLCTAGHTWVDATCVAPKTCSVCDAIEGGVNNSFHHFTYGICDDCGAIQISETTFPDQNFRSYIMSQTYGADGVLTNAELQNVTSIHVNSRNISDMTGIGYFTALETLDCFSNQLTSLDVSKNTALENLFCEDNQLTSLDVSGCTALTALHCFSNQLTSLDVSGCTALTALRCYSNQLTSLDVSDCTNLWQLLCNSNQLTSLDVSGCTWLGGLNCSGNQLTSLDLSGLTELGYLDCHSNQLTSLDVSNLTWLEELYCQNNQLTSLDVSGLTELDTLSCSENERTVSVNRNQFDLSTLAADGFDVSKASNWQGGTVSGNILTATADTVTYTYNLGNGETETFTLVMDGFCSHNWTPADCENPKTCSLCGATEGEALGHAYESGICSRCDAVHPNLAGYSGKTISILGDSISTFTGVSNDPNASTAIQNNATFYNGSVLGVGLADTWWQQTVDALDLELLVNNSWSGSCIYTTRAGTPGAYVARCEQLHNNAGTVPDVIAIYLGTNDYYNFKSTLGSAGAIDYAQLIRETADGYTYAEPTTAMEAYAIMLHKMTKRYPMAEIYCFTLLPMRNLSAADQLLLEQFNDGIKELADRFDVNVVDLYTDSGIKTDDHFQDYIADNSVHPGPLGMDAITDVFVDELLEQGAPASHTHSYYCVVTPPTCTEQGYTTYTCTACGGSYVADRVPAKNHDWQDADCETAKTCKVCGETEGEPLVHSWQEANCVSPERCVHCNDTRGEIDPYGHKFYNGNCKYCGVKGGQCGDQVYWTLVDGKLTVYGSGDMYHYQGVQSPWTSCRPRITQLEVIDGVTSVGNFAFNAFSNLTTVTLADSVTRVGRDAFAFCEKLQTVDLGDGLTEIGHYALRSCTSLQEVTVPGSVRIWGTAIFQDCTALESATLEAGVSSVGEYLFLDCTALKTVTLPEGVRSIRESAFDGCSALEEIHIPDTTATIGNDAFNGCGRLTVLVIPESVTNIGYQAFDGCDKLTEVYYGGTEEVWNTMTGRPHVSYLHLSCTQPEGHWTEMTNPGSCVADSYTYDGCACGYERNIRNVRPGSDHDWIPADCDTPKTCSRCGETEGEASGHTEVCGVCTACGIGLNLGDYQYTLDESAMTATLTDYIGSGTDVHVAASYLLDGKEYRTLLEATSVFRGNTAITSVKIHDGVTVASNSMAEMFYGCASLKTADLTGLDTTGVTSLRRLFSECKKLTGVDVTGWDTSAVEDMSYLFDYCSALTTITGYENWNTGSVWNISKAFNRTTSIDKVDLSQWDLSKITNSGWCFQICYAEEILLPDNLAVMSAGFLNHPAEFAGSTFRIPGGVKKIGYAHTIYDFGTDAFTTFEVPAQNGYYEAVDGILYSEDGTELLAIPRGKTFENGVFEVPNTVTFMGELSFSRNYNIETLVLPDNFIIEYVPLYDSRYIIEDGHGGNDTGNLNSGTNLSIAIYCYTGITAYDVRDTNTRYEAVDGVIYSEDMTTLVAVPARYAQHLNIPEGVTTWNKEAMWADHAGNSNLLSLLSGCTGVSIPSTLCEIDAEQLSMLNALADRTSSAFTITVAEGNRTFHVNPTTGHLEAHTYSAVVTEPTCENAGYTTHTCSICGDHYKTDPVPAKEHDWAAADCDTPKTCKVCGETEGAPLDHNWTPADCENPKTCTRCGATEGTSTGHAWIEATCYSLKTCNNCGTTVGEMLKHDWVEADCQHPKHCKNCTATEGSALNHDWADADCENAKTCKRCGATEGTSTGHAWIEASCYNPRTCSVCGKIDSVSWGHDWTNADCENPATCKNCGLTRGEPLDHIWVGGDCENPQVCSLCGLSSGIIPGGHDWQAVVDGTGEICNKCGATRGDVHSHTWQAATCIAPETCTSCGVTRGQKLPHTPVVDPAVEATCTTEGKSEGSHCAGCLQPLVAQQVIPLKAHTEVTDKAVEATCTATGLTEGKHCSVCGKVTVAQQIVPKKNHTWLAATCTENNTCKHCGKESYGTMLPHTEVIDHAVAATCAFTGLTEGKHCSVCGTVTVAQQVVPTKAHVEVPDQAVAATCTTAGKTEGSHCAVCGKVLKEQDKIPAMGHTPVVDAAVEATCSTEGLTAGAHCVVCDQVIKAQETIAKKDHTWKAATCSNPKTCTACGATSGYALGHDWASGNCTTPRTCKTCGVKDGGVVHSYEHQYDYKCDLCGTERIVDMTRPMVDMFRMYNPNTGEHFYTGSTEERDNLIAVGWQYEGVGFTFPLTTGKPVHRLFQPSTGEHLYTMDEAEKDKLMAEGWNYEGIAFNSGFENEVPQYRLHNPNATVGAYHFTASLEEKNNLLAAGWEYQGIGWYSLGA